MGWDGTERDGTGQDGIVVPCDVWYAQDKTGKLFRFALGEIARILVEFLEVAITSVVFLKGIYPPGAFERRKYMNLVVHRARHPEFRDYIYSAGLVERVAVIFFDGDNIPVERFMFKLSVNQSHGSRVEEADLEFSLRSFFIKLPVAEPLTKALPQKLNTEVSDLDLMNIKELCDQVLSLSEYRAQLYDYLKNRMNTVAPNLTALVGELVGAHPISHGGSLLNLAKQPGSIVQILGAEKALFRALKTKHATPKYGLIECLWQWLPCKDEKYISMSIKKNLLTDNFSQSLTLQNL
ncbi:hypothetical protein ACFX11_025227 [Malus domestica]